MTDETVTSRQRSGKSPAHDGERRSQDCGCGKEASDSSFSSSTLSTLQMLRYLLWSPRVLCPRARE